MPGRGHNRPPPEPRRPALSLDSEPVQSLLAELMHLRGRAIAECNGALRRFTDAMHPWRFSPSQLAKWPTGRAMLAREFLAVWDLAIEKRLGQLRHLNGKLARTCAEWRLLTDTELAMPPAYAGDDRQAYETVHFPGRPHHEL